MITVCTFTLESSFRSFFETQLTAAAELTAGLWIERIIFLAVALHLVRVVTAVVYAIANEVLGNALSVDALNGIACATST